MQIDILSLFPTYFKGPFEVSIIKRALERNLISIRHIDIRDFSKDKHKKVLRLIRPNNYKYFPNFANQIIWFGNLSIASYPNWGF